MPSSSRDFIEPDSRRFWHPSVEMLPPAKLRRSKRNARTHSTKQRDKLHAVVQQCGFINPILIDGAGMIISGHLRLEVAKTMGLQKVPVIRITHLTDLEKRALALAENRIALDAGWDRNTLAAELGELTQLLPEAQIEFAVTGFDIAETDIIINDHADQLEQGAADELPAVGPRVQSTRRSLDPEYTPSVLR